MMTLKNSKTFNRLKRERLVWVSGYAIKAVVPKNHKEGGMS